MRSVLVSFTKRKVNKYLLTDESYNTFSYVSLRQKAVFFTSKLHEVLMALKGHNNIIIPKILGLTSGRL
jgi:hypothetical protein